MSPAPSFSPDRHEDIVIIGGGIIGCCVAYYITRHPNFSPSIHSITIIEAARVANGASGKAGGLLASWAYPSNLAPLSFDLHEQLAGEHNGPETWGYRRVHCGQLSAVGFQSSDLGKPEPRTGSSISLGKWWNDARKQASVLPEDLNWLNAENAQSYDELADAGSTAQVHPFQFTLSMAKLAEERGARITLGTVEHINCDDGSGHVAPLADFRDLRGKKAVSVTYMDKNSSTRRTVTASNIVVAAGPWTPTLFPKARMSPLRAHSVSIKLKSPVSAYCLFTDITIGRPSQTKSFRKTISPEIYGRPNNEVYMCSQGDIQVPLPLPTEPVEISSQSCQEIIDAASSISEELRNGQVTMRRACYLPTMAGGVSNDPLVGWTDVEGLLLATRHSCWGILNAPATGKVISELILDGEVSCIDIGNLDPRRVL